MGTPSIVRRIGIVRREAADNFDVSRKLAVSGLPARRISESDEPGPSLVASVTRKVLGLLASVTPGAG